MQIILHLLLFLLISCNIVAQQVEQPPRLSRAESFFGLHFDLHARETNTQMGENVTPEMVQNLIDQTNPDYIQIDCKGHPGYSSYPTKVGNPVTNFVKDPLKIWREVTAKNGVALYMHYSGVIDGVAVEKHPEWAVVDAEGRIGGNNHRVTSVFSPYVDQLLIPQLKELSRDYQVDGVWVDGENWALEVDYSQRAQKAFTEATGITNIPKSPEDPHYQQYLDFNREAFRQYLEHYISELHQFNPDFQIASNWAYSSYMPEPVTTGVDFISGDFSPLNSLNRARIETRVLRQQGVPWDLMAWGFTRDWRTGYPSHIVKTPNQIRQEASIVLSQGGGFMVYLSQRKDASLYEWTIPLMAAAGKFCRERQEFTHKAEPVPQIGMLLPHSVYYQVNDQPFGKQALDPFQGILQALINNQLVVDVVLEHNDWDQYPMLIYPEWYMVPEQIKNRLLQYVEQGGKLLIIGPEPAAAFQEELGVTLAGKPVEKINGLEHQGWLANNHSISQRVELEEGTRSFGRYYQVWDKKGPSEVAASIRSYGEGTIAATYLNFGEWYLKAATQVTRDYLGALIKEIFPEQMVEVKGSPYVDVTLNKINGQLALNLVNTAGPHDNDAVYTFDNIPEVGPLYINLKVPDRPKNVLLHPGGQVIDYQYDQGEVSMMLPKLQFHQIILVEDP